MVKKLRRLIIALLLLALASLLSVYSYGRFARQVQGEPGTAIPAERIETMLDRAIAPLTDMHPGESGLTLLSNNLDAFALRGLTAREAERSLDLQYYIWHDDLTGRLLGYELLRAADRGVRVRLLLDDLNAHDKDDVLSVLDRHPNIEVRLFNPSRGRSRSLRRGAEMLLRGFSLNRRMHNKAWIADGRLAVVGGRNIGDEYFDAAQDTNFRDADIAAVGPVVAETAAIFDEFWNSRAAIPLAALRQADVAALEAFRRDGGQVLVGARPYLQRLHESDSIRALFFGEYPLHWTAQARVYSDPAEKAYGQGESRWLMNALWPVLGGAHEDLWLISPYFVPGEEGTAQLRRLHGNGVRIDILTNSLAATDVVAVHSGYARYRESLLQAGITLSELMPHGKSENHLFGSSGASLHTKAFVVDGASGFVGSFNLDPRSIRLNTEMGIVFEQAELSRELRDSAETMARDDSYRLSLEEGGLRWTDQSVDPPRQWTREPEASVWRRAAARVIGWLPIESQL